MSSHPNLPSFGKRCVPLWFHFMLTVLAAGQVIFTQRRDCWKCIKGCIHLWEYLIPFPLPHSPFLPLLYPSSSLLTSCAAPIPVRLTALVVLHGHWRVSRVASIDALWSRDSNSVPSWAVFDSRSCFRLLDD